MKIWIAATLAGTTLATAALAQDAPMDPAAMTCADFVALDATGQAEAVAAMTAAAASAEGAADNAAAAPMTPEEEAAAIVTACGEDGAMLASDARTAAHGG